MHLPEGIASPTVLLGGGLLSAVGLGLGLWRLREERLPQAAMLSSAFFVVSLIHLPIGVGSVHLMMSGLLGLVLGWAAVPAIVVALALQAVLFGHGGLTTLGVNTLVMALPAVLVWLLFDRPLARCSNRSTVAAIGFAAGAMAMAASVGIFAMALYLSHDSLARPLAVFSAAHGGLLLIEGLITASTVVFIKQVRPEMFQQPQLHAPEEVTDDEQDA